MSIELEIAKEDLLSLWRTLKSQRESFLQQRDSLNMLISKIEAAGFVEKADSEEVTLLNDLKTKLGAISK